MISTPPLTFCGSVSMQNTSGCTMHSWGTKDKRGSSYRRSLKAVAENTGSSVPKSRSWPTLSLWPWACRWPFCISVPLSVWWQLKVFLLHRILWKLSILMPIKHLEQYLTHGKHSIILIIIFIVKYIHSKNNIKCISIIIIVVINGERKMKHTWVYKQSPFQTVRLLETQFVLVCTLLDSTESCPHKGKFYWLL